MAAKQNTTEATPVKAEVSVKDEVMTSVTTVVDYGLIMGELSTSLGLIGDHAASLEAIATGEDMGKAVSSAMALYDGEAGSEAVKAGEALVKAGKAARDAHTDYRVGIVGAIITRQPAITDKDLAVTMFGEGSYAGSVKVMVLRDRAQVEIMAAVAAHNVEHKDDKAVERITLADARKAVRDMPKVKRQALVKAIGKSGAAALAQPEGEPVVHTVAAVIKQAERLADMLASMGDADKAQADLLAGLLGKIGKATITRSAAA
jgi:hypothetical protein